MEIKTFEKFDEQWREYTRIIMQKKVITIKNPLRLGFNEKYISSNNQLNKYLGQLDNQDNGQPHIYNYTG